MSIRESQPNYHEQLERNIEAQNTRDPSSSSCEQSLSVARSSIPPSSAPIHPGAIVANAINSVISKKGFKETLKRWVSEGASEEERQEAADRMLQCFRKKEKKLDLDELNLWSLPSCIGNLTKLTCLYLSENQLTEINDAISSLTQLTTLSLSRNRLTSIPGSIGNLRNLDHLGLIYNQLTAIPVELLQLSVNCDVYLEGNPFSENVFNQLNALRDTGPQFYVSMAREENQEISSLNLEEIVAFWLDLIPTQSEVTPIPSLEPGQESLLTEFLRRLGEIQEYRNAKTRALLAQRVTRFLNAFAENEEFRKLSLQIIEESLGTCGDKVSLGLLRIECQWKIQSSQNISLQEVAKLAIGMKRLELLETIAREKVKTLQFVDEVEVYLAYMTQLASSLALPIDSQDMLFFKISGVTEDDLKIAEKTLIEETSYPNQIIEDLLQFKEWTQKIREVFKDEVNPQLEQIDKDTRDKEYLLEEEQSGISNHEYRERYNAIAQERKSALHNLYSDITKIWIQKHYNEILEAINSLPISNK